MALISTIRRTLFRQPRLGLRNPRRLGPTSGQAMTEAVVTMTLLAFTWMFASYLVWLAENRVRTAAATRHVVWSRANNDGTSPTIPSLISGFLEHQGNTFDGSSTASTIPAPSVSGPGNAFVIGVFNFLQANFPNIYTVDETDMLMRVLGVDTYPYTIMGIGWTMSGSGNSQLTTPNLSTVNTAGTPHQAWPRVDDLFEDRSQIFAIAGSLAP